MKQSPSDISYRSGTTGHTLTWVFEADESNDSPAEYNISIDGEVLSNHLNEPWQDNQEITVNVDGLSVGEHTVEIKVWDSGYPDNAGATTDTATVTVTDAPEPYVDVSDQLLVNAYVTIDDVFHNSTNGWIVIHANNSGSPGEIIGYSSVTNQSNPNVLVQLNVSKVTDSLFAMLHNDTGVIGDFEFPSTDAPMKYSNGSIIMQSFEITNRMNASVSVNSGQTATANSAQITVTTAVSPGPGWVVIHADNGGSPGDVLGYSPLVHGENSDVIVEFSGMVTETMYAMLHYDNGTRGTFDFPGADSPVMTNGSVVVQSFTVNIDTSTSDDGTTTDTTTDTTDTETTLNETSPVSTPNLLPIPIISFITSFSMIAIITVYLRKR